jgi:hypothetical protein
VLELSAAERSAYSTAVVRMNAACDGARVASPPAGGRHGGLLVGVLHAGAPFVSQLASHICGMAADAAPATNAWFWKRVCLCGVICVQLFRGCCSEVVSRSGAACQACLMHDAGCCAAACASAAIFTREQGSAMLLLVTCTAVYHHL